MNGVSTGREFLKGNTMSSVAMEVLEKTIAFLAVAAHQTGHTSEEAIIAGRRALNEFDGGGMRAVLRAVSVQVVAWCDYD